MLFCDQYDSVAAISLKTPHHLLESVRVFKLFAATVLPRQYHLPKYLHMNQKTHVALNCLF